MIYEMPEKSHIQKYIVRSRILPVLVRITTSVGGDLGYDLNQWFSAPSDFVPQETTMSGDSLVMAEGVRELLESSESRPGVPLRRVHRAASTTRNYVTPNVNSAEVRKLICSRSLYWMVKPQPWLLTEQQEVVG